MKQALELEKPTDQTSGERFFRVPTLAKLLDCSPKAIYHGVARRTIPPRFVVRLGKSVLISSELLSWLRANGKEQTENGHP